MTNSSRAEEILVVDDSPENLLLYGALLARGGYRVSKASGGAEALQLIQARQPTLLLLDYMMPEMDGGDVLRCLRDANATRDLPVIILTASMAPADIERALTLGADDYITKPVDPRILLARIKSIIQAKTAIAAASVASERDAMWRELQEAREVQRAQLPHVPTSWTGWSATGGVVPSGHVAGDVFDLIETNDGRRFATLIDVSGHGTASALVAAETRTMLRNLVAQHPIAQAVEVLSRRLTDQELGKYACLAVIETNASLVTIVNAGLPPVVIVRGDQVTAEVVAGGFPVGMFSQASYESVTLQVAPGDRVVVVSDGLTEAVGLADDTATALSRLRLALTVPLGWTRAELEDRIREVTGSHDDDATLLLLERT